MYFLTCLVSLSRCSSLPLWSSPASQQRATLTRSTALSQSASSTKMTRHVITPSASAWLLSWPVWAFCFWMFTCLLWATHSKENTLSWQTWDSQVRASHPWHFFFFCSWLDVKLVAHCKELKKKRCAYLLNCICLIYVLAVNTCHQTVTHTKLKPSDMFVSDCAIIFFFFNVLKYQSRFMTKIIILYIGAIHFLP